jgi:biotin synthase
VGTTCLETCARRLEAGQPISREDALALLAEAECDPWPLLHEAGRICRRLRGRSVYLCSIVAVKLGRCGEDCRWCAQSARWKTGIKPRPLLATDELLRVAQSAAAAGARNFCLVSSGARPSQDEFDAVLAAGREIGRRTGLAMCAGLGAISHDEARRLLEAGFVRYNHNLETSARHFPKVCSTHTYEDRVRSARAVRQAGLELCCGGLFGMGETDEDRVDLALAVRDLGADVVPLNFLHPIPGTPLADAAALEPLKILSIIALFRLLMPDRLIKVAGGRGRNLRDLQSLAFLAGADSCIIGNYLTTAGRPPEEDIAMFRDLGLEPARGPVSRACHAVGPASRAVRGVGAGASRDCDA